MNQTNKAASVTVNYTQEQEAELIAASPVSFEMAQAFADEWGKSVKSIVAKVHNLKAQGSAIEYVPKARPTKKPKGLTKADLVERIEARLDAEGLLKGLSKAPAADLRVLLNYLPENG